MENFRKLLQETLADNQMEAIIPSREYTENERVYMKGYTDALADMLEDFNDEFTAFMKNAHTFSLN